jgi:hypothetical protein
LKSKHTQFPRTYRRLKNIIHISKDYTVINFFRTFKSILNLCLITFLTATIACINLDMKKIH